MVTIFNKIAIVTLYDNINIGNKLQNFAVKKILEKYCVTVETLTYSEAYKMAPDMGWKGKIVAFFGVPREIARKKRAMLLRRKKFEAFSAKYLNARTDIPFYAYGLDISYEYDAFVTGSDQVWHNWSNTKAELDYFFLDFVPKSKRICLSPSFGLKEIPKQWIPNYIKGLSGFNHLSCREKDGCELIKKTVNREATLLLDPTMIIEREQWDSIAKKPDYDLSNSYILVYILGPLSNVVNDKIIEIASKNNLNIINIYNIDDRNFYTTSPDEFIYLVKNASLVCTNSFHGLAFSILYSKKVYIFNREDKEGIKMGGRIETLLKAFNLNFDNVVIDERFVETKLNEERRKFYNYLDMCFDEVRTV